MSNPIQVTPLKEWSPIGSQRPRTEAEQQAIEFANAAVVCTHAGIYNLVLPIIEAKIELEKTRRSKSDQMV